MSERKRPISRRGFLKSAVGAGVLLGLGVPNLAQLRHAAAESGIRAHNWHTLPRNDGRTLAAGAGELGGDFQLLRNADGSYQASRTFVSEIHHSTGRYNMVGMRWVADMPEDTSIAVEVRSSVDGSSWSEWAAVGHALEGRDHEADHHAHGAEVFTDPVELGRANLMQYRITLTTDNPANTPTVRRVTATQLDALDSPTLEDLDQRGRAIPFRVGNGGAPTARLILRDGPTGWGPSYIAPDDPRYWPHYAGQYPFSFVTIHHTAGANNPENPVATVRAVWYFHAITRGWGDIGYHFLVDQYGNVYQGRDGGDATEAGHTFRYNHYNCGISLLGQFHPGARGVPPGGEPTPQALDSAMRMAAFESAYHGINPLEQKPYNKPSGWCRPQLVNYGISGHRDWGPAGSASCVRTVCPGENVHKHLPAIRQQAAELIPQIKDFSLMQILNNNHQ